MHLLRPRSVDRVDPVSGSLRRPVSLRRHQWTRSLSPCASSALPRTIQPLIAFPTLSRPPHRLPRRVVETRSFPSRGTASGTFLGRLLSGGKQTSRRERNSLESRPENARGIERNPSPTTNRRQPERPPDSRRVRTRVSPRPSPKRASRPSDAAEEPLLTWNDGAVVRLPPPRATLGFPRPGRCGTATAGGLQKTVTHHSGNPDMVRLRRNRETTPGLVRMRRC